MLYVNAHSYLLHGFAYLRLPRVVYLVYRLDIYLVLLPDLQNFIVPYFNIFKLNYPIIWMDCAVVLKSIGYKSTEYVDLYSTEHMLVTVN